MKPFDFLKTNPADPALATEAPHPSRDPHARIQDRLVREVEAMTQFAMATGIPMPPELMAKVDGSLTGLRTLPAHGMPAYDDAVPPPEGQDRTLLLAAAHAGLTVLIAPAKPGSLLLLSEDRRANPRKHMFGAVPMVRWMLGVSMASLALMLGVALSNKVNAANMTKGLLNLSGGDLLFVEVFLVAAAAVGASLANLKRLDQYISNCTYELRFDSSYWTRLAMGVISGIILSQVMYSSFSDVGEMGGVAKSLGSFGQPILALLGGFSAELVHDILTRLIGAISNLFGGKSPPAQIPS